MSRGIRILLMMWLLASALTGKGQQRLDVHEGDLVFCCTDSANAITAVTSGVERLPIDHVAVVHRIGGDDGPLYVIEAVKPVVRLTSWNDFLSGNGRMLLARVNGDVDVARSVRRCLMMVGKPYDDLYLPGDSAVYCSELVQMNYVAIGGELVFETVPMSFHDASGRITDYWLDFYARRGMAVPEGAPGTNPGELSRRERVTILGEIVHNAR